MHKLGKAVASAAFAMLAVMPATPSLAAGRSVRPPTQPVGVVTAFQCNQGCGTATANYVSTLVGSNPPKRTYFVDAELVDVCDNTAAAGESITATNALLFSDDSAADVDGNHFISFVISNDLLNKGTGKTNRFFVRLVGSQQPNGGTGAKVTQSFSLTDLVNDGAITPLANGFSGVTIFSANADVDSDALASEDLYILNEVDIYVRGKTNNANSFNNSALTGEWVLNGSVPIVSTGQATGCPQNFPVAD